MSGQFRSAIAAKEQQRQSLAMVLEEQSREADKKRSMQKLLVAVAIAGAGYYLIVPAVRRLTSHLNRLRQLPTAGSGPSSERVQWMAEVEDQMKKSNQALVGAKKEPSPPPSKPAPLTPREAREQSYRKQEDLPPALQEEIKKIYTKGGSRKPSTDTRPNYQQPNQKQAARLQDQEKKKHRPKPEQAGSTQTRYRSPSTKEADRIPPKRSKPLARKEGMYEWVRQPPQALLANPKEYPDFKSPDSLPKP